MTLLFCVFWLSAQAQLTTVRPASVQSSSASVTDGANAFDASTTTKATLGSVSGTLVKFLEVQFASDVPVNTPLYIQLEADPSTNFLGGLLGGALGNFLNGVINFATIGTQTVGVQAKTDTGTNVYNATASSSYGTDELRVVTNGQGKHFIRLTLNNTYRRLRITNTVTTGVLGGGAAKLLDVYDIHYVTGATTGCSTAAFTSYDAYNVLGLANTTLANPQNAIDNNLTTYSNLSLGTLTVGEWVEQTIYFQGTASVTDKFNLRVQVPPALLAANLIQGITVTTYGVNGAATYTTNLNTLLGLPVNAQVLGLLQNNQIATLQIAPNAIVNRITIRFNALVALSTAPALRIYEVNKSNFDLAATGAGTYYVGSTPTLGTTITNTTCTGSTYSYAWTLDGGDGTVLGTGATFTPPTTTTGTFTYNVTAIDNTWGTRKMASVQIIVVAVPPTAGSLNNIVIECTDVPVTNLTLTGNVGGVVRWEKADNPAFTNKTNINVTTTFLTPAQMNITTTPAYFRAVVTQNGYPEVVTTTGGVVSKKETTWDGSAWSNGTPDIGTTIYFTGNYSVAANLNGCRAYVSNNAVVTIPSGHTLHLNKSLHVAAGSSFSLENEAHLLQDTSAEANTGNITVTRASSNLFRLDYTLWSSPVTGQNLKAFSPLTVNDRFYEYGFNATANEEQYLPINPLTTSFANAKGYLIRMPNDLPGVTGYNTGTGTTQHIGVFTGAVHNGTVTTPLSTISERYTAVGNPFPSAINVHDFFTANSSVIQSGSALYFWRKKNNWNATSYATLTWDTYTYNHALNGNAGEEQYGGMQWDSYFNDSDEANWTINIGQGFLIQTSTTAGANPVATFNTAMRRGNVHNNQFFRTAQDEDQKSRIWLSLQGAGMATQAALVYSSTATMDIDYGRDARALLGGTSNLWSILGEEKLVVQARPSFVNTDVVPMGYNVDAAGEYSIVLHNADGVFEQGQEIFIKDNLLGTITSISEGEGYTFTSPAGEFTSRFEVVYVTDALGTNQPELANMVMVYQNNGAINITSGTATMNGVTIYDVRGRKLYEQTGINATQTSINNLNAAQQVLIVEIDTVNGKVSKKIVY